MPCLRASPGWIERHTLAWQLSRVDPQTWCIRHRAADLLRGALLPVIAAIAKSPHSPREPAQAILLPASTPLARLSTLSEKSSSLAQIDLWVNNTLVFVIPQCRGSQSKGQPIHIHRGKFEKSIEEVFDSCCRSTRRSVGIRNNNCFSKKQQPSSEKGCRLRCET